MRISVKKLGTDDYLMCVTLVSIPPAKSIRCDIELNGLIQLLYLGNMIFFNIGVDRGDMHHIYYLSTSQVKMVLQMEYSAQVFVMLAPCIAKWSVSFLLLRIMGPFAVYRKWFIMIVMTIFTLYSIANMLVQYLQCIPPRTILRTYPE